MTDPTNSMTDMPIFELIMAFLAKAAQFINTSDMLAFSTSAILVFADPLEQIVAPGTSSSWDDIAKYAVITAITVFSRFAYDWLKTKYGPKPEPQQEDKDNGV